MKKEKIEVVVLILVGIVCFGLTFTVLMKYILPVISPFLIAWFVAFAVRGPARWLAGKTHISEKIWRPTLAVGGTLLIFCGTVLLLWQLVDFLWRLLADITGGGEFYAILVQFSEPKLPFIDGGVPDELAMNISDGIRDLLGMLLEKLGTVITSVVSFVPRALLFLLITVISLLYFSIDIERINGKIKSFLPTEIADKLSAAGRKTFSVIGKYVKSYLQIMLITFVIMLVGFVILGVERAFVIAVIVSVLDLLPVLGVGIILVPWSVCALAIGNRVMGIGLLIIFVAYTVIRELLEPKILGKSLDIHPIVTLISLYVGYALFGVMGLIVFPIGVVIFGQLFKKDKSSEVS